MFERYTEKARRVIFFARYEASEFGSSYIESEFLLLGLLREGKSVVTRWLGEGDWQTILREEVRKSGYTGEKISTSVDLPLSNESKRVLAYAAEEAALLSHPMIGTEHLFLGLLREPKSTAARILLERGVDVRVVRETLAKEGTASGPETETRIGSIRRTVPIFLVVEKGGETLHPFWQMQVPAVGDRVTVRRGEDDATVYEVVRVESEVTSARPEPPYLSKVLVHVREQPTV
jgi:ATP-dependent Clp protease ATP-binding subunit ClpA